MKRCTSILVAAIFCCTSASAFAAANERVVAVMTDGSVQLETTGKAMFANIRFPDAKLAESWLAAHLLQQKLTFDVGEADRYGRMQISSDSEEKMIRDGIALIYAGDGSVPESWFGAEKAAHSKKLGVWAQENLVVTPQNAAQHENEFHVIEGTITRIYENKTGTYLNFGEDWHSDFSITIPAKLRRSMKDKLVSIKAGSRVRVRGTLYEEDGPMVMLNHADNLGRY